MRQLLATWFLNRAKNQIGKDRDLKLRVVIDDGIAYFDVADRTESHTTYPVSEDYYSNLALFFQGYVNEMGIVSPDDHESEEIELPQHEEIKIGSGDIEAIEQTGDVQLTTTESYRKHMTNHVFQQALEPVDPNSLGGMAINKYYIWTALILLAIMAFGVASGGFTSALLLPLIPAGRFSGYVGRWFDEL